MSSTSIITSLGNPVVQNHACPLELGFSAAIFWFTSSRNLNLSKTKNENENGVIQARFMKLKRGILTCGVKMQSKNEPNFLSSESYGMIVFLWKSKRVIEVEFGRKILIGKN